MPTVLALSAGNHKLPRPKESASTRGPDCTRQPVRCSHRSIAYNQMPCGHIVRGRFLHRAPKHARTSVLIRFFPFFLLGIDALHPPSVVPVSLCFPLDVVCPLVLPDRLRCL